MDRKKKMKLALLTVLIMVLIFLVVKFDIFNRENIENIIISSQEKGLKFFVPIVTGLLVFFVPLGWFTFISALLFEWKMIFYIIVSAILAALISFLISKIFKKGVLRKIYEINEKKNNKLDLDSVWQKIDRYGKNYIIFIRAMPVIPYTLVNYIAGVSNIGFKDYLLGTVIGMTPTLLINMFFFKALFNISKSLKRFLLALSVKLAYILTVVIVQKRKMRE